MKKILIAVLLFGLLCGISYHEHNYTRYDCKVIEATPYGAIFKDQCGFTWAIEGEDYEIGQVADLKMHDNFSNAYIEDDIIKKVIKRG